MAHRIAQVWYSCQGGDGGDAFARLDEEDSDGDIPIIGLTGAGYWDFREFGGIPADKSSNGNQSDVNFVVPSTADSVICIRLANFKKFIRSNEWPIQLQAQLLLTKVLQLMKSLQKRMRELVHK